MQRVLAVREDSSHKKHLLANLSVLTEVANNIANDSPISILCVAGPVNSGKRLLLRYIIQFLQSCEKNTEDWLNNENKSTSPISDILLQLPKSEKGTFVYPKPFKISLGSRQVRVLLMITQASKKDFTSDEVFGNIITINILLSSCFIFNSFDRVPDTCISALGRCTGQAKAFGGEKIRQTRFGNLVFVCRDWNSPSKYWFGNKDGKRFLVDRMTSIAQHIVDMEDARTIFSNSVADLQCYLLPRPKFAGDLNFKGTFEQLGSNFVFHMEKLIMDLVACDMLKPIYSNLAHIIDVISNHEQSIIHVTPKLNRRFISGSRLSIASDIGSIEDNNQQYQKFANSKDFKDEDEYIRPKLEKTYIFTHELITSAHNYYLNLLSSLVGSKPNFNFAVESRIALEKAAKKVSADAKFPTEKRTAAEKEIRGILKLSEQVIAVTLQMYEGGHPSKEDLDDCVQNLSTLLVLSDDNLVFDYINLFNQIVEKQMRMSSGTTEAHVRSHLNDDSDGSKDDSEYDTADSDGETVMQIGNLPSNAKDDTHNDEEIVKFYNHKLRELVSSNVYMTTEELIAESKNIANTAHAHFSRATFNVLETSSEMKEFIKINEDNVQALLMMMESLHEKCRLGYTNDIQSKLKSIAATKDLMLAHQEISEKWKNNFVKNCPEKLKRSAKLDPFITKLLNSISSEFENAQRIFNIQKSGRLQKFQIAKSQAEILYREEMDKHFYSNQHSVYIRPTQLDTFHANASEQVLAKIQKILETTFNSDEEQSIVAILAQQKQFYVEQNDMNLEGNTAIGIDLGTTFCCMGVYTQGKVLILTIDSAKTMPSYVSFQNDGSQIIGNEAKNLAYQNPEHTIYDAKRIIGRKFDDPHLQSDMELWAFSVVNDRNKNVPKIAVQEKTFFPEQISALILGKLKKVAENFLHNQVTRAVVTVPAYFNDGQRQATINAGKLAGFENITILTEPTAAAIAYRLQYSHGEGKYILIFDLGGGTFDVALLKTQQKDVEVLALGGDDHLGGEDFDKNVMKYCAQEFKKIHGIDLLEGKNSTNKTLKDEVRRKLRRLQNECERKKIQLTNSRTSEVNVDNIHGQTDLRVTLTRAKFEEINAVLFETTIQAVKDCLASAKLKKTDIAEIVLVGGSTKMPKIREMLESFFSGKTINSQINPDEAVAYGAAVHAAIMNGIINRGTLDFTSIQDVTPMSLGVEVKGGNFSKIITKNTKVPHEHTEQYVTTVNNQTEVRFTIFQGEDTVARNNKYLGEFILTGVPKNKAGKETIDVRMQVNAEGVLHVTAKCVSTGKSNDLTVTEHKIGMDQHELAKLLKELK